METTENAQGRSEILRVSLRVSVMSAAETQRWHGFAAGAGVWRRNGGEAERGVVWKQQKVPPGQTKSFKFLFSGAH
jgi:hypothetical protein